MLLIGASAFVMFTFRMAMTTDALWAKIASLIIQASGCCFIVYAVLFLIANLFSATTTPILDAIESSAHDKEDAQSGDTIAATSLNDSDAAKGDQ